MDSDFRNGISRLIVILYSEWGKMAEQAIFGARVPLLWNFILWLWSQVRLLGSGWWNGSNNLTTSKQFASNKFILRIHSILTIIIPNDRSRWLLIFYDGAHSNCTRVEGFELGQFTILIVACAHCMIVDDSIRRTVVNHCHWSLACVP